MTKVIAIILSESDSTCWNEQTAIFELTLIKLTVFFTFYVVFFFQISNSRKWNNVNLQENTTRNIFVLAAILDFLKKQSQN